jgi:hypothetical protein
MTYVKLKQLTQSITRWHRYLASLIETNVLKFMSSLYIILFYNLFVTIWCKDNKLIIYLST